MKSIRLYIWLCIIFVCLICGDIARGQDRQAILGVEVGISDVIYSYDVKDSQREMPSFSGSLSFTVTISSIPARIIVMRTLPYQTEDSRLFFAVKYELSDFGHTNEIRYTLDDIDWGTFVAARIITSDGESIMTSPICSTDYLTETDKCAIDKYQASLAILSSEDGISIMQNRIISNCGEQGFVSIFNIQGCLIYSSMIAPYSSLEIPDSTPRSFILKVQYPHNTITRKILQK